MAKVSTKNAIKKALAVQRMEPFCTAIDFVGINEGWYGRITRFCFECDKYPYEIEMRKTIIRVEICIRNAYNGDVMFIAPYRGDCVDVADYLYERVNELGYPNDGGKLKRLIYKIMIGDLPIELFNNVFGFV